MARYVPLSGAPRRRARLDTTLDMYVELHSSGGHADLVVGNPSAGFADVELHWWYDGRGLGGHPVLNRVDLLEHAGRRAVIATYLQAGGLRDNLTKVEHTLRELLTRITMEREGP